MQYSKVIGKIAIKVIPDTRRFKEELESDLDRIERQIRDLKVGVKLDEDQIVDDVKRVVERAQGVAKAEKIRLHFDDRGFDDVTREIGRIDDRLRELARNTTIDIDIDDAGELEEWRNFLVDLRKDSSIDLEYVEDKEGYEAALKQLRTLQREAHETLVLPVELNRDSIAEQITEFERKLQVHLDIEDARKRIDEIRKTADVRLKTALDAQSYEHVRKQLEDLVDDFNGTEVELQAAVDSLIARAELARVARDRIVTIHARINQSSLRGVETALAALSGARLLGSTVDNLRLLFENLDKNLPMISALALAVQGLTGWLLAAGSNTFALSRSLAQIGGVGLTLPGILAGAAIGIGSLIAVMKDFDTQLPHVGDTFSALQDAMSSNFWSQARTPIRAFIDGVFPALSSGLLVTSDSLAVFTSSLANSLAQHFDVQSLSGMFANLATSIDIAAGGTDDWASAFEVLGRRGSEYLPRLAEWTNSLGESFNNWLLEADADGRLVGWIETGITQALELGRALGAIGGILVDIGQAAERSGGSTLTALADTLERVEKATASDGFQNGLVRVLTAAHEAMANIAGESGPAVKAMFTDLSFTLAQSLPAAGSAIGKLAEGVATLLGSAGMQAGIVDLFNGLNVALDRLAPAFEPVGDALGRILAMVGNLSADFAPLLTTLFVALSDIVIALAPSIEALAGSLSGLLLNVGGPILEGLTGFIDTIAGIVTPILESDIAVGALTVSILGMVAAWKGATLAITGYNALMKGIGGATFGTALANQAAQWLRIDTNVTKLNGSLAKLAKGGLIASAAAAITAIAIGIGQWATNLDVAAPSVDDMTLAIKRLGEAGANANLDSLFQGTESFLGTWLNSGLDGGALNNLASDVNSLGDALGYVNQWADANIWDRIWNSGDAFGGFGAHSAALNQSKESLLAFDEAAAQVVASGNQEEIAALAAKIAAAQQEEGISAERLAEILPQYTTATQFAALAEEERAAALAASGEAVSRYRDVMAELGHITPGMVNAISEGAKAFFDLSQDIDNAEVSLDGWLQGLKDQVTAQREWADNMALLAAEGLSEAAISTLAAMGPESAMRVAEMASLTGEELDLFIADLNSTMEQGTGQAVDGFGQGLSGMSEKLQEAYYGLNVSALPAELIAELEAQGAIIADGVVVGFQSVDMAAMFQGSLNAALDTGMPQSLPPSVISALESLGFEIPGNVISGTASGAPDLTDAVVEMLNNIYVGGLPPEVEASLIAAGFDVVDGVVQGISDNTSAAGAGADLALGIRDDFAHAMEIHSPSRVMMRLGQDVVAGLVEGLNQMIGLDGAMASIAQAILGAFTGCGTWLVQSGIDIALGLFGGISSQAPLAKTTGEALGQQVKAGADSVPFSPTGQAMVSAVTQALEAGRGSLNAAGANAAAAARDGMGSVSMSPTGAAAGAGFASGLGGAAGAVRSAAQSLAGAAVQALAGMSAYSSGMAIGYTFARGLTATVSTVSSAAKAVAAAARGPLPNSPADTGPFAGSGWGGWGEAIAGELAAGLTSRTGLVAAASESMMRGIDLTADGSLDADAATSGGGTHITVHADVKDLAGIRSLEEFVVMSNAWRSQYAAG